MKATVIDQFAKEVGSLELKDDVFNVDYNNHLVFESIINENANARQGTHNTKTRSEVHGSGKKPWRQKGTGRARAGSKKSPVWRGGGIAFGPRPRDYSYKMPKKMKRKAYKCVLSDRIAKGVLKIVQLPDLSSGKTKDAYTFIKNMNEHTNRIVLIYKLDDQNFKRAFRNIPNITILNYKRLNLHDLYYAQTILLAEDAAELLNEHFTK